MSTKVTNTTTITNETTGQLEVERITTIYNLDAAESHDTAAEIDAAVTSAISGFDPVTGTPLK